MCGSLLPDFVGLRSSQSHLLISSCVKAVLCGSVVPKIATLSLDLGAVHMETLFCVNPRFASFWPIVYTDPVNAAPVNALFSKSDRMVEKS